MEAPISLSDDQEPSRGSKLDLDRAGTQTKSKLHNPCVRNCCLNENDVCLGCFRTLDEIKDWYRLDRDQRQQVLDETETRKARTQKHFPRSRLIG